MTLYAAPDQPAPYDQDEAPDRHPVDLERIVERMDSSARMLGYVLVYLLVVLAASGAGAVAYALGWIG